jgi:hypothetical protein
MRLIDFSGVRDQLSGIRGSDGIERDSWERYINAPRKLGLFRHLMPET